MPVDTENVITPNAAVLAGRRAWRYTGASRPEFAESVPAGEGYESVWDYPRPPRQELRSQLVEVCSDSLVIARSERAVRVAETASAPTWYVPPEDVQQEFLQPSAAQSLCEWKGLAQGFDLVGDSVVPVADVGWRYIKVFPEFQNLQGWYAFYPQRIDCYVDGERMQAQPGGYYGGWVAANMLGPIKGSPGSSGW